MEARVRAGLRADGLSDEEIEANFEIDVRYKGQAFEVPLAVTLDELRASGLDAVARRFDEEHHRLFTFNMDVEHEFVNLRAVALGRRLELPSIPLRRGNGNPIDAKLRDHEVWIDGGLKAAAIYDRARLLAGDVIPGPAVVIEMDATTLIEHAHEATVDSVGNLLIMPS
jgi:N-methylhydantoinase A